MKKHDDIAPHLLQSQHQFERLIEQDCRWLRFPKPFEQAFQRYYVQIYLYVMRRALVIGGILFFLCTLVTDYLLGFDYAIAQQIRFVLVAPVFGIALALLYYPTWHRWRELGLLLGAFAVGLGCIAIGQSQALLMSTLYYQGLYVVMMFGFTVSRLRFWYGLLIALLLIILSTLSMFWRGDYPLHFILGFDWVYLAGMALMAFSSYTFELHERKKFIQTQMASIERKRLLDFNQELLSLANLDPLTEVANKRYFFKYLANEWRRAMRHKSYVAIMIIDVDNFKSFNDRFGHLMGDKCLQAIALAIKENVYRPYDLVARYGGDEFIVLLTDATGEGALKVANAVMTSVRAIRFPDNRSASITVSIGLESIRCSREESEESLIERADKALYFAKKSGRNRVELYNGCCV